MKQNRRVIIRAFLRSMRPAFTIYGVALFSFGMIAFLTRFPFDYFWYSVFVFSVICAIYSGFQGYGYYGRYRDIERLPLTQITEIENFPEGHDPSDQLYQDKLVELAELYYRDMQKNREAQQEQLDYFTLWLHQIKTPIAAMSLLNQGMPDSKQKRQFEQELIRVEDYTHMALSYLKLTEHSQELDVETVEIDRVLRRVIKKYAVLFIYNQIQLDYQPTGLQVVSDEKWLEVLFELILSNSLKYAPKGKIRIFAQGQTLVMEDNGMGIRAEDLPKIFEKGYSGMNGRLKEKSTGLGLFLSRKICQRLGHDIHVESELNKYTKVSFDLSRKEVPLFD